MLKIKLLTLTTLFSICTFASFGQSPGGVATINLVSWQNPSNIQSTGTAVTGWGDASGGTNNYNISAGTPLRVVGEANGHDVVRFDGDGDFLRNSTTVSYSPRNVFIVYRVSKLDQKTSDLATIWGSRAQKAELAIEARTAAGKFSADGGNGSTGKVGLNGEKYGSANKDPSAPTPWIYDDPNNQYHIVALEYTILHASANPLTTHSIGEMDSSPFMNFGGDIAEIIVYDQLLDVTGIEKLRINNYLGNKYGIALTYNTDLSTSSTFVLEDNYKEQLVFIGNHNGMDYDNIAGDGGAAYLERTLGSFGSNENIWMSHNGSAHGISNTDVSGTSRWKRVFRLQRESPTGTSLTEAKISFGTQDAGFGDNDKNGTTIADYKLLYRAGNTGLFSEIAATGVFEDQNKITYTLSNAQLKSGNYTLGIPGGNVFYSYLPSGDWNDPDMWTLDPSGTLYINDAGAVPTGNDEAVILNGKTVIDYTGSKEVVILNIKAGGILDVQDNTGNIFTTINGEGTIRLKADNFPSYADITDFASSGKVEFYGDNILIQTDYSFYNVDVNLDAGKTIIFDADLAVNGNLVVESGKLQIGDDGNDVRTFDVNGDIDVQSNGLIDVDRSNAGTAKHILYLAGNFTNEGTCRFSDVSTYDYNGSAVGIRVDVRFNNAISDQRVYLDGPTDFYRIVSDKGVDANYVLDIEASAAANFRLLGKNNFGGGGATGENQNALGLKAGTVKLNNNIVIPSLFTGSGNYDISEMTTLWLHNSQVTVPASASTAVVIYGKVLVSGPLADLKVYMSSGLTMRGTGVFEVQDGNVELNQFRTSNQGPSHKGAYVQSGGLVTIDNNFGGGAQAAYFMFDLAEPDNTFKMSGGTLHVKYQRHEGGGNSKGAIFLNCAVTNQEVTGGTVIVEVDAEADPNAYCRISSGVPFYNLTLRNTDGDFLTQEIRIEGATSGTPSQTITDQALIVKGDLLVESNATLAHMDNNIEVYGSFEIENGGDMPNGCNLYMLGDGNAYLKFNNKTGAGLGGNTVQNLNYFIIDKGSDTLFVSGGKNLNGDNNNIIDVKGPAMKLLSGTFDQTNYGIKMTCDTLVNYGTLGVYDFLPNDNDPHSGNDVFKFTPGGGGVAMILLTNSNSKFGRIRINSKEDITEFVSDVKIQSIDYRNGRFNIGRYNLKVDELEFRWNSSKANWKNCGGCASVQDMIVTDGNESDGGLSLLIPIDGKNTITGTNEFIFPFGIGTTGVDADTDAGASRYTPVTVTIDDLTGVTEAAYITLRPINKQLKTMNLTPNSDYLNYYWRTDNSYTAIVPKVKLLAKYYDADVTDDGDGGATTEGNFVPGKVLDDDPYTRSSELVANINTTDNLITFDADGGNFSLENANYTAGVADRFTGAPDIFYSRATSGQKDWDDTNEWRQGSITGPTGTYPTEGSIAIIRDRCRMNVRIIPIPSPAKVVLDHDFVGYPIPNSENLPRLQFHINGTYDMGKVTGTGMISFNSSRTINLNGDFGDIGTDSNSVYLYFGGGNRTINNTPSPIPSLMIEGGSTKTLANPLDINFDLIVQGDVTVKPQENIQIGRDLLLGFWLGGTFQFPSQPTPITVTVERNIDFTAYNNNGTRRITVQGGGTSVVHNLILKGDIIQGNHTGLDLWNSNSANRVNLILQGNTDNTYTRTTGNVNVPELYRIIMSKGSDKTSTFTFSDDFILEGPSIATEKPVELINGTLILDDDGIDINLSTGGDEFLIINGSGLEVRKGEVNIADSDLRLDGCLIVSGGTVDMNTDGNNNDIIYTSSGGSVILVTDGDLNVGGQVMRNILDDASVLKYTQSGGNSRFGMNGASHPERGVFELIGTGSEYTRSGGNLSIQSGNNSTVNAAFAIINPSVFSESGTSTITIGGGTNNGEDIGINCTEELNTLELSSTGDPRASMLINPLKIQNLIIGSGSKLQGNDLDIYVSDTWTNNEGLTGFDPGSGNIGTITCQGSRVDLSGDTRFNHLINNCSDRVVLASNTEVFVNNLINNKNIYTTSNDLHVSGNTENFLFIYSTTGSVVFDGTSTQYLSSRRVSAGNSLSFIDKIRIDNTSNLELLEYQGKPLKCVVLENIELQNGEFVIGDNYLSLFASVTITGTGFSKNKMIRTNGRTSSKGIKLILYGGQTFNEHLPIGVTGKFSPVDINLSNAGPGRMDTDIRAVNEQHPTTLPGVYTQQLLEFYWRFVFQKIGGGGTLNGTMVFTYDQNDVTGDEINTYGSAKFEDFNWILEVPPGPDPTLFPLDVAINEITFLIENITSTKTIDYTCGDTKTSNITIPKTAFPITVPIYYSQTDISGVADWNVDASWKKDNKDTGPIGIPQIGARVVIQGGDTITFDQDLINVYNLQIDGKVKVNNTIKHNLGIVTGEGIIELESGQFPGGSYDDFLTTTGGVVEYAGTGDYTTSAIVTAARALIFSGTGTRTIPALSTTIGDSIVIDGVTLDNTVNNSIFDLEGDIAIRDGGTFLSGTGGINFIGSTDGHIKTSMTGVNQLAQMTVSKSSGGLYIDGAEVFVKNTIDFQKGRIIPGDNKLLMDKDLTYVTDPWDSSYVQGIACKELALGSDFSFPVGDDYKYAYSKVYSPSAGQWCSRYFVGNPTDDGFNTNSIKVETPQVVDVLDQGYWELEGPISAIANGGVGLNWRFASNPYPYLNDAVLVEWDASSSEWYGKGGAYITADQELKSDNGVTFSKKYFTFGFFNSPLPVDFLDFNAKFEDGYVSLDWTTASELNNLGFDIERSYDLKTFTKIGFVEGNGTTSNEQSYIFFDDDFSSGTIYYRLKQVDFNGEYEYSKVVSVTALNVVANDAFEVVVYPNPSSVEDELTFKFKNYGEGVSIIIYDITGTFIYSENELILDDLGKVNFTLSLNKGIYIVNAVSNNETLFVKLLVE